MWTFVQSSGKLKHDDYPDAYGYAGNGYGKNNPAMESIKSVGPLPCGRYNIIGPPVDTMEHGPYVMHLNPNDESVMFGRSGFLMHGDSLCVPGNASEGCIVVAHDIRVRVWESGDRSLEVIAHE